MKKHLVLDIKLALIAGLLTLLFVKLFMGCMTPRQAGDGTKAACELVQAFSGADVTDSICASAAELVELGVIVANSRDDSGARKTAACTVIPTTNVCATNTELSVAIRTVKAKR